MKSDRYAFGKQGNPMRSDLLIIQGTLWIWTTSNVFAEHSLTRVCSECLYIAQLYHTRGRGCTLMCIFCKPFVDVLTPLRVSAVIGTE